MGQRPLKLCSSRVMPKLTPKDAEEDVADLLMLEMDVSPFEVGAKILGYVWCFYHQSPRSTLYKKIMVSGVIHYEKTFL